MDKYEFNIKVEQIKKLISKSDYVTAMNIADTIDWRKVRNSNLLSTIALVYEKNKEYQEAKDLLLLAYERAPVGKRFLYKLTELALKEDSVEEAEMYYHEFCKSAPEDPRQNLLRYLLLSAKGASLEQRIRTLENYTSLELDEKWLYELAELYEHAGMTDECVRMCDRIMLMFGIGKYVDKAVNLKVRYAPLTQLQKNLLANNELYEEEIEKAEGRFEKNGPEEEPDTFVRENIAVAAEAPVQTELEVRMQEAEMEERLAQEMSKISIEEYPEEEQPEKTRTFTDLRRLKTNTEAVVKAMPDMAAAAAQSAATAEMVSGRNGWAEESLPVEQNAVWENEENSADGHEIDWSDMPADPAYSDPTPPPVRDEEAGFADAQTSGTYHGYYIMIGTRSEEDGLKLAKETLKYIHRELGNQSQAAKITGEKLNRRGVLAAMDKLAGKDLIIEQAGDLWSGALDELNQLIESDNTGMNIVLIDYPERLAMLRAENPDLAGKFECADCETGPERPEEKRMPDPEVQVTSDYRKQEARKGELRPAASAVSKNRPNQERYSVPARKPEPERVSREEASRPHGRHMEDRYREEIRTKPPAPERPKAEDKREEHRERAGESEMDSEEFAQYACQYAEDIDCSIAGKSLLALYERIEIMEEDGLPLTRENAELLIEEAADKAEKPSLFKLIKGIFSPKYDKDGMLILKEEHFIS